MFNISFNDIGSLVCLVAAIISLWKYKSLSILEKPIVIVICLNLIGDLIGYFLSEFGINTGFIYNILLPTERIISLYIYASIIGKPLTKRYFTYGMGVIVLIRVIATWLENPLLEFQYVANTVEGLFTAIMSYFFIRLVVSETAEGSVLTYAFGIANFVYLTLMASAMSALPLARAIDNDYSKALYGLNIGAYIIWLLILITAMLWKKKI